MINIPIALIKEKIIEATKMAPKELDDKIKAKLEQLSGLISEEGAAHIIANEMGVNLMQTQGVLKIKTLLPGMKNIEVTAKILKKYELREFKTEKREGKLAKFLCADETGTTMVVMWNEAADDISKINEGDILIIRHGSVRDNTGRTEIHLSELGNIEINPKGVTVQVSSNSDSSTSYSAAQRKKIKELTDNDQNVEIFSTIVQVFDPKFFEVDPDTGKRIRQEEGAPKPAKVGYGAVLNLFADDGSDNIRVVLWKNQILNLLKCSEDKLLEYKDNPVLFETVKTDLLGMMVKLIGRVSRNQMFDRLEFIVNVVLTDVNPDEEIKKLNDQVKPAISEQKTEPIIQSKDASEKKPVKESKTESLSSEKQENVEDIDEDELLSLEDLEDLDD